MELLVQSKPLSANTAGWQLPMAHNLIVMETKQWGSDASVDVVVPFSFTIIPMDNTHKNNLRTLTNHLLVDTPEWQYRNRWC